MKIKLGTCYMTEGGHEVRIYVVDCSPVHGAYLTPGGWEICEWNMRGQAPFFLKKDGDLNLVEVARADTFRGHSIELSKGLYIFSDTKELVSETWKDRPCGFCKKSNTSEGHDGCIGTLRGVMNACCGHGKEDEAYIQFENKYIMTGAGALSYIEESKDV